MGKTDKIIKKFNRIAPLYDLISMCLSASKRRQVTALARGKVLEVGVGTGNNLKFYDPVCEVTGIDFSPGMLERAKKKAAGRNNISILEMDIEDLKFPDNTFNTIISTCVFCSVPNPDKGLAEIRRVCKPGGQLIFLEHTRINNSFLGPIMDLLNPLALSLMGANINRNTLDNIKSAGLIIKEIQPMGMEMLKLIIAKPGK